MTQDVQESDGELQGHTKKLSLIKFHPSADYTLASTAADNTCRIWDVSQQSLVSTYDLSHMGTSIEWSQNGSLLACVNKGKQLVILDPRKPGEAVSGATHEGARQQKLVWAGDNETIITTGFSKVSERQFGVFDIRDLANPLEMRRLDDYPGIGFPFFDEDHKVFFVAGKGEMAISYYQFSKSGNYLDVLSCFRGKEPQKGFSMMPKRCVDVMESETMRGVRMTAKTIEYVKFKVPRKTGGFSKDLYPDWKVGTPAHDFASYWSGVDKEPIREEVEATSAKKSSTVKSGNFMTKLTGAPAAEPAPVAAASGPSSADLEAL